MEDWLITVLVIGGAIGLGILIYLVVYCGIKKCCPWAANL